VPCRFLPGFLIPADLTRLCPDGDLDWVKTHLRASPGIHVVNYETGETIRLGTLVPARVADSGACHWFVSDKCQVHADAPFGCAFFDEHMSNVETVRRGQPGVQEVMDDWLTDGPYSTLWRELHHLELTAPDSAPFREQYGRAVRALRAKQDRHQRKEQRKRGGKR
jgi:hypothetical protein